MTGPAAGALCRAVGDVCAQLRPALTAPTRDRLDAVTHRLSGPLQLAVAGRIKSGKSTVVNALIGRRVAPTDVRECTRVVTRFQYGTVDRVEVVRTNGRRVTVPYDGDGLVPADLGVPPAEIAFVDAFLTSGVLRTLTVIDTPGLGSLDAQSSRRTQELLGVVPPSPAPDDGLDPGSQAAIAQAEAVLYVLTQAARADDVETLSIFQAYTTPRASSPVNAVGVLTRADQFAADDPVKAAADLARAQARALRHRVHDVLPLAGLVAETTETGRFTEADADMLRRVAALDPQSQALLFSSVDLFLRPEIPVPERGRARLLELLDLYGVRMAIEVLDADPRASAGELRRRLIDASGFARVRAAVEHSFGRRSDGIKANVALAALDGLAADAPPEDRGRIRDAVEDLLQQPAAHELRLFDAAALVTSGTVPMPDDLAGELSRLVIGDGPDAQLGLVGHPAGELAGAALDAAARWRSFATFGATPAQSRVAHVVHRAYFLLYQGLR